MQLRQIATVLLTLPDGRIVFQRRGPKAPISPNLLGFFGGHVEPGESNEAAARRELGEETSLNVNEVSPKHLADYIFTLPNGRQISFHLYQGTIKDLDFKVFEGERAESYAREEALARDDLTINARHALTNIVKGA